MAEERTMSVITKLNSPDRASQKVSTLFDMALIRQYYKRKENTHNNKRRARPTVRFVDLSKYLDSLVASSPHSVLFEDAEELEHHLNSEDPDNVKLGRQDVFEAETVEGVLLSSKVLTDVLADTLHNSQPSRLSLPIINAPVQPQAHQPVDVSEIVY
ncbi:hypothetical protein FRC07_007597 [Ceratobasidium sp. 392]|nr:hypothetical protein FRC07_007597 [Ceratobasidium sp. 392]